MSDSRPFNVDKSLFIHLKQNQKSWYCPTLTPLLGLFIFQLYMHHFELQPWKRNWLHVELLKDGSNHQTIELWLFLSVFSLYSWYTVSYVKISKANNLLQNWTVIKILLSGFKCKLWLQQRVFTRTRSCSRNLHFKLLSHVVGVLPIYYFLSCAGVWLGQHYYAIATVIIYKSH